MADDAYAGFGDTGTMQSELNRTRFLFERMANGMATAIPVKVVAVDGRTVDVQPAVNQTTAGKEAISHGTINGLPVWRPQAGGVAIIMVPVVGDMGLAVFCHSDISSVKANDGAVSNPGSSRKFDYSDGVYLGGLFGDDDPTVSITIDPDDGVVVKGAVDTDEEYRVDGTKVVGAQQGAIADPTGGVVIDVQARVTLIQVLTALRTHGLIDT